MGQFIKEVYKFVVVGILNFFFTLIMFYVFVNHIKLNYLIALLIASLIGMIFTYLLNYLWVFKPEQGLVFKNRLFKYIFSGFLSIILNLFALKHIVDLTNLTPFNAQIMLIPFVVILNFAASKFWSLKQS